MKRINFKNLKIIGRRGFILGPLLLGLMIQTGWTGDGTKEIAKDDNQAGFTKPQGIEDRAAGTHNASNIGLFFENRGKLYPRRLTDGPSGEFPIGSGKHYIYRMNPFVGIPGNVVQGRYTTNEEWEAVGGYHNPALANIAFSDNPNTWPASGWPVKDASGNPIIKSDQDSYCVYSDSNNTVRILGLQVAQTGYAYGLKFAQDMIFYKYEIINKSTNTYDSLFFSIYFDCDIGNVSGGVPEYADDYVGYESDRKLLYMYDDGISTEWPGGVTGRMGVAMLRTPEVSGQEQGVTGMHWNEYSNDIDLDDVQYGIIASKPGYIPAEQRDNYFHPGNSGNMNFDDVSTIPSGGGDLLSYMNSGPYTIQPGDTLAFYTVLVAGNDQEELDANTDVAYQVLASNFELPKPPATPTLTAVPGNGRVTLYWDDAADRSVDKFSGEMDFEGYRLYRSTDKGLHWDQINRNVLPVGPDPVPLADFDRIDGIGTDKGIQYSFVDSSVTNGFEYWYTITAYDRGTATLESLESARGNTTDALNTVSVIPVSPAAGRQPVAPGDVWHTGNGASNYLLRVEPTDNNDLANNEYALNFSFFTIREAGDLKTRAEVVVEDSAKVLPHRYGIKFTSDTKFDLLDLTTDETIRSGYTYRSGVAYPIAAHGIRIMMTDEAGTDPQFLPQEGDYLSVNFAVTVLKNAADTVVTIRPISFDQRQVTSDGVIFSLHAPNIIQDVSRMGGTDNMDITFSIIDETLIRDARYLISVEGNGQNASGQGFVSISIRDSANTLQTLDSLYSGDSFDFDGVEGTIKFPENSPPSPGNVFSLITAIPRQPNLQDGYKFTIKGALVSQQAVRKEIMNVKVVPNPYIVGSLYEPEFGELRKEPLRQLQFINLPTQSTIYIYTVAGDLVKTIHHTASSGTEIWDLRTDGGREIATGIYIYVVKTSNDQFMSRFAVIK